MGQKVTMNEQQLREYVENEVRKALMSETKENSLLSECINEAIEENMTDESVISWLQNLLMGGQNNPGQGNDNRGISAEGIIGAILGRFFAPVLRRLLEKIGIMPDSAIGKVIVNAASTMGGYGLGQLIDKKWDLIPGIDGKNPATK